MLLLDEPTEGLAPVIIQQIGRTIARLKQEGFTIVLVEQNFRFASTVADRHYVVEQGRVVDMILNAELDANIDKLHAYLGV
jgi:branched-chain amino acid transport system ATP-binding protein